MTPPAMAYWVVERGRGELRAERDEPVQPDQVVVEAMFSAVSAGTERLVGLGLVPAAAHAAMACRGMGGSFALPVKYGYALVGRVANGALAGKHVFTMHPHQDRVVTAGDAVTPLPRDVPPARGTLLPNLETAWNAVADAELRPGERVAVVGGGAVGLLCAFVLWRRLGQGVLVVDRDGGRRTAAAALPFVAAAAAPDELPPGAFDVVFHATGHGDGLQLAIDALGFEGRVVELSWYGDRPVALRLGGAFHWQRQQIVSSQVATVARSHRAGGPAARTVAVLDLLRDAALDSLLPPATPFADLPAAMARLYRGEATSPLILVDYGRRPAEPR